LNEHPYRAPILPVADETARPLWSVMVPTYNCADYLSKTLTSVLVQDPGPEVMQIEVVDDCSSKDDPARVVEEIGGGRVHFFRQPANGGHVRNFNTCLQRSRGRLVHLLHGDDCVRPDFYRTLQCVFLEHPEVGAAFCRDIRMDENDHWQTISPLLHRESGILDQWLDMIAVGQRLQAPSMVVRRDVYEQLHGFDSRIASYGEDWEMWVRIAARYPVWYEPEPLALYRIRSTSLTGVTERTGKNAHDYRRAIEINRAHLPPDRADHLSNEARRNFAMACLRRARRKLEVGETGTTTAQIREALKTHRSLPVVIQTLQLLLLWLTRAGLNAKARSR
jgi:glycosyltransferase involved in cell wall biosynthesis